MDRKSRDDVMAMSGITDEGLVGAALSGDDEAFAELIRRHKRKVASTASRFARDIQELDDICQDIFIKVYQNLGGFRGDAPFSHWLMRIAVRTCYDALRARRRERLNVPLDSVDFALGGPSTEGQESARHAKFLLDRVMPRLKPEERLVITLVELEGYSVKEVAGLTGWSESNVKVRAFRARHALKKLIGEEYETG